MQDEVGGDEKKSDSDADDLGKVDDKAQTDEEMSAELLAENELTKTEELQEQVSKANEQVLRVQAEMQNVRRRAERDVGNAHKFALEKFAGDLLPVVDNLERALGTISAEDEAQKAVSTGLELTLKSFIEVLEKFKIEAIDPSGQPFDAELHQAVSMVPNPDLEPNTVMDVFQKGYTLNGRLVRPAMVVVSQGS